MSAPSAEPVVVSGVPVDIDASPTNAPVVTAVPLRRQMSGRAVQILQGAWAVGSSPALHTLTALARSSRYSSDPGGEAEGHRRAGNQRRLPGHPAYHHSGPLVPGRLGPSGVHSSGTRPSCNSFPALPPFSSPTPLLTTTTARRPQYCETTDLSLWALVLGWVGMGIVIWQFLVQVWFWKLNWKFFTTGGEEAQRKTIKRLQLLKQLPQVVGLFQFGAPHPLDCPRLAAPRRAGRSRVRAACRRSLVHLWPGRVKVLGHRRVRRPSLRQHHPRRLRLHDRQRRVHHVR